MTSIDTPKFLAKIPGCLNTTQRTTVFPKEEANWLFSIK